MEVLTGSSQSVVVRISGPDLDVLGTQADGVQERLEGVRGLVDLHVEHQEAIPQLDVQVDLAAARRYGLKPGDVRRAAAVLVQNIEVNDIWKPTRVFDVTVWSVPSARSDLTALQNLPLDTPGGGQVRLGDVADLRIAPAPNVIKRENVTGGST